MKSFFDSMTWPRSAGRLHVYAFANPAVARMADAYHEVIDRPGLPRQPDEFLHVTIEQIQRYADDLPAEQIAALVAALAKHIAAVPAFDLTIGPALLTYSAVGFDAVPDEPWAQLRQAVRTAAVETFGDDGVKPMHGPGAPHITLAYATREVEFDSLTLLKVRAGRATLPVNEVHLVAVTQNPATGVYSWPAPIASLRLGVRHP